MHIFNPLDKSINQMPKCKWSYCTASYKYKAKVTWEHSWNTWGWVNNDQTFIFGHYSFKRIGSESFTYLCVSSDRCAGVHGGKGGTFWLIGHNRNSTLGRWQWMHIAVLLLRLLTSPSAANPTLCLSPADENTGDQAACHSSGKSMCVCMCAFIAVYGLSCGA